MWRDCPAGGIFSLMVLSILSSPLCGMILVCDRYELIRSPGLVNVVTTSVVIVAAVCLLQGRGASAIFMSGIGMECGGIAVHLIV